MEREIITIKRSNKDQKQQLFELLKNTDEYIIMMSAEWFHAFTHRNDVRRDLFEFNPPDELVYEIYENEKIVTCKLCGRIEFDLIRGLYFLKECDFLNYTSYDGKVASKIVFLE